MNDKKSTRFSLDELARQLAESVPQNLRVARPRPRAQFQIAAACPARRMELVTREEFDLQRAVLERTRGQARDDGGAARRAREVCPSSTSCSSEPRRRGATACRSRACSEPRPEPGLNAYPVTVEVHLSGGLPGFAVTGLPAAAVRESKDRVRAALMTCGYDVPVSRITVHLGPADVPKARRPVRFADRARRDRCRAQAARWPTSRIEFLGELALNGDLRPDHRRACPQSLPHRGRGRALVLPAANAGEAGLVAGADVYVAKHLNEVVRHLDGVQPLACASHPATSCPRRCVQSHRISRDVRGQAVAKRALTRCGGGRAQHADDRPARQRQEHARRAARRVAAAARARRDAAGREHRFGRGRAERGESHAAAAVSRAAPHGVRAGARRRRHTAAARRNLTRASRRAVSRRAARVLARRARGAARAARERRRTNLARPRATRRFPPSSNSSRR